MNRLKELRKEKKLSQKEIAKLLEFNLRTYQRMENGESQIKPDKAQQLADFFGVSVGYLLGYTGHITKHIKGVSVGDLLEIEGQPCRVYKIGDGYALLKEEGHGVDSNRNN